MKTERKNAFVQAFELSLTLLYSCAKIKILRPNLEIKVKI